MHPLRKQRIRSCVFFGCSNVGLTGILQPEYPLNPSDVPTRRLVTGRREHLRNRPHPSLFGLQTPSQAYQEQSMRFHGELRATDSHIACDPTFGDGEDPRLRHPSAAAVPLPPSAS
ncbi:jg2711 [Pararge aegeria aegeria]|uniref:Jg2711 protein n=1 Tax=Pararge aegeria aegeria TaxID=348720 RepID=A0A8S4QS37_9NEOP|nr:jg2711 [Pararge aegeria aegeria]